MKLWKEEVAKTSQKASDALADPEGYENLFPDFKDTLKAEQVPRLQQCVCVSVCAHHFHWVHVVLSLSIAGCTVRRKEVAPNAQLTYS